MALNDIILTVNNSSSVTEYQQEIINLGTGGLLAGDALGAPSILTPGSNNEVLIRDSGEALGLKWGSVTDILETIPVSKGGTGLTSVTANKILSGNGTGALSVEDTIEVSPGILRIYDSSDSDKLFLIAKDLGSDITGIYSYDLFTTTYDDILIGSTIPAGGIYIDKTNDRIGIFNGSPTKTLDINGDLEVQNMTLKSGSARTIGIDGITGDNLIISAGDDTSSPGGDLYLAPGDGNPVGKVYLGSKNGFNIADAIYVETIAASSGTDLVTINASGLLGKKSFPSNPSSTAYLTVSSSGLLGTTLNALAGTSNRLIYSTFTPVSFIDTNAAEQTIKIFSFTNGEYTRNPQKTILRFTVRGMHYIGSGFGNYIIRIGIRKGTLLGGTTILEVDGELTTPGASSMNTYFECIIDLYAISSISTRTYGRMILGDDKDRVQDAAFHRSTNYLIHGSADEFTLYCKDNIAASGTTITIENVMIEELYNPS